MAFASWLDARPSLELAVMFVTWAAIVLLALIVTALHVRLQRLEHASRLARSAAPYGHLVGRHVWKPARTGPAGEVPEAILLLSSRCRSCESILEELRYTALNRPLAVAWKDGPPEAANLPSRVTVLPDGATLSAELGVSVTPFALKLDREGVVRAAMPVGSLRSLELAINQATAAALT